MLKRNRTLKVLNLSENKLDVQCLVIIAEALKYNSSLETLDLNKNPCSGPGLEGIQSLRTAFTLNTALKRLFLSSTSMTSAGAIALAEFLPESTSLLHLDLTMNSFDIAGVMALSSGLKANHVMRCLDVNIPPGDEEFARMCREILNSCVRNTEEAERITKGAEGSSTGSGRGLGKGVWGMIEESELAKSIRKDEEKKIESDVVVRARACLTSLANVTAAPSSTVNPEHIADAATKARVVVNELTTVIQETEDPIQMEELLGINDQLLALLKKVPGGGKPTLTLYGLGLSLPGIEPVGGDTTLANGSPAFLNGHANGHFPEGEDDDDTPTTPRIDKGKRKAEPEPEVPEKVLSPTFLIAESSEDEDEDGRRYVIAPEHLEEVTSPTDRSRSWVEEEGEVFRRGTILLGPEEMEGEYAGEELRKELLEAMVERPPPRPLTDDFGIEIIPGSMNFEDQRSTSSVPPSDPSPTIETPKPSPRPYISRTRSTSSSIMSLISPVGTDHPDLNGPVVESLVSATLSLSPTSPGASGRPYFPRSQSSPNVES